MRKRYTIGVPVTRELKLELELEAWEQGLAVAEYVRVIIERSRKKQGKQPVARTIGKRGRPRLYRNARLRNVRSRSNRAAARQARQAGVE